MFFSSHNTARSYVTILTFSNLAESELQCFIVGRSNYGPRKFRYDKTDTNGQQENRNTKKETRPYNVTIFRECLFVVAVVVVVVFVLFCF